MSKYCKKITKHQTSCRIWFLNPEERCHNLNGPAGIIFFDQTLIRIKEIRYYIDGLLHRNEEDGPAIIRFDINGNVKQEVYYFKGKEYRRCGPSYIEYKDNSICYMEWRH